VIWIPAVLCGWRYVACDQSLDEVLPGGKDNWRQRQRRSRWRGNPERNLCASQALGLACCQSVSRQSQAVWKAKASKFIVANILARYLLPCPKLWTKL
jgi:hypothetical protein